MIKKGKTKEAIRLRALDVVNQIEDKLDTTPALDTVWNALTDDERQDILECCLSVILDEFGY